MLSLKKMVCLLGICLTISNVANALIIDPTDIDNPQVADQSDYYVHTKIVNQEVIQSLFSNPRPYLEQPNCLLQATRSQTFMALLATYGQVQYINQVVKYYGYHKIRPQGKSVLLYAIDFNQNTHSVDSAKTIFVQCDLK